MLIILCIFASTNYNNMKNESIQIAKTIQQQLFFHNKNIVWSWGAHAWTALENALEFKVQGFKFKGVVKITLIESSDTYKIEFFKSKVVVETYNDVYFDGMVDIIDKYVELTDEYVNDVKKAVYIF